MHHADSADMRKQRRRHMIQSREPDAACRQRCFKLLNLAKMHSAKGSQSSPWTRQGAEKTETEGAPAAARLPSEGHNFSQQKGHLSACERRIYIYRKNKTELWT